MKIILSEIRRYLRPVTLLLAGAAVVICYVMYGKDCNDRSRNNYAQPYLLSIEYQRRFGNAIDRAELEEIKAQQAKERAALDALFEETMGAYGIHCKNDFDLLRQARDEPDGEAYAEALSQWGEDGLAERLVYCDTCMDIAWSEPVVSAVFREQSMRSVIKRCELLFGGVDGYSYDEISLINAVYDVNSCFLDFLPWHVLIGILCVLIVIPLPVRNRVTRVRELQFSAAIGRSVLNRQLAAALIVTVCVNLLIDALFFTVYFFSEGNTRHLLGSRWNNGALANALWLDLTYRDLILLYFVNTLLLSLALTCLLFVIACCSQNYITALAAAVPCVIAETLAFRQLAIELYREPGSAVRFVLILAAALTVAAAAAGFLIRQTRTHDDSLPWQPKGG